MLSPLRNRFGPPGVIAVIALVFAMLGGAYAATSDNGGKATASAKGPRGPRGPKGPKGDPGPAGPQGPAGPAGAKGDTGAKGDKGDTGNTGGTGSAGVNGKSAEAIPFSGSKTIGSVTCTEGGLEVKSASATTLVCNGAKGANGTNGTNGTTGFTETLPSNKTEMGSWAFGPLSTSFVNTPISFTIPLENSLGSSEVHFIAPNGEEAIFDFSDTEEILFSPSAECLGSAAAPSATPGNLCVYAARLENASFYGSNMIYDPSKSGESSFAGGSAGPYGARINTIIGANGRGWGSWAVTAP